MSMSPAAVLGATLHISDDHLTNSGGNIAVSGLDSGSAEPLTQQSAEPFNQQTHLLTQNNAPNASSAALESGYPAPNPLRIQRFRARGTRKIRDRLAVVEKFLQCTMVLSEDKDDFISGSVESLHKKVFDLVLSTNVDVSPRIFLDATSIWAETNSLSHAPVYPRQNNSAKPSTAYSETRRKSRTVVRRVKKTNANGFKQQVQCIKFARPMSPSTHVENARLREFLQAMARDGCLASTADGQRISVEAALAICHREFNDYNVISHWYKSFPAGPVEDSVNPVLTQNENSANTAPAAAAMSRNSNDRPRPFPGPSGLSSITETITAWAFDGFNFSYLTTIFHTSLYLKEGARTPSYQKELSAAMKKKYPSRLALLHSKFLILASHSSTFC